MRLKSLFLLLVIYALLAYPMFYFVYKFGDPIDIAHDFFQYYRLYNNWDWHNVNAPFNMRLISSFLVFVFNKIGFYYETASAFDKYLIYGFDKCVYFNALVINYLSVAATSCVIFYLVNTYLKNNAIAFISGLIYLLGFGTIFFEIMPCTDAFSTLLFAFMLVLYLQKNKWLILIITISIFQREYVIIVFGLLASIDWLISKEKYFLKVCVMSVLCFIVYFILRKTLFYTSALSFQTSPSILIKSLFSITFPIPQFIKQTIITLNIFVLYLIILAYKFFKNMHINRLSFFKISLLLVQIILVSFAAILGNNAGRYFYMVSPFIIFELAKESAFLFKDVNE